MKSKLCYEKLSSLGLLPKLTLAAVWGCMLYLHDPLDLRSSSNKAQISTHTAFSVIPRTFQRHMCPRVCRASKRKYHASAWRRTLEKDRNASTPCIDLFIYLIFPSSSLQQEGQLTSVLQDG